MNKFEKPRKQESALHKEKYFSLYLVFQILHLLNSLSELLGGHLLGSAITMGRSPTASQLTFLLF